MRKLYEINSDVERLLDEHATLRLENGQAVDTETGEIFSLTERLEKLELEKTEKIESVAFYADDLIIKKDALDARIKELQTLSKSIDKQITGLTGWLLFATDNKGIETDNIKIKVTKSSKTIIDDELALAERFIKTVVKTEKSPDKTAIKQAIANGEIVTGAHVETSYNMKII